MTRCLAQICGKFSGSSAPSSSKYGYIERATLLNGTCGSELATTVRQWRLIRGVLNSLDQYTKKGTKRKRKSIDSVPDLDRGGRIGIALPEHIVSAHVLSPFRFVGTGEVLRRIVEAPYQLLSAQCGPREQRISSSKCLGE